MVVSTKGSLTEQAHALIIEHFNGEAIPCAVDATCGNGYDTAFLLKLGCAQVVAFDIQQSALDTTQQRLSEHDLAGAQLVNAGHQFMQQHINQAVDCVMFNFGYLPHGDKSITTQASSSLSAINAALGLLSKRGIITLLCYPGHQAGSVETSAIQDYLAQLKRDSPMRWQVNSYYSRANKPTAPVLFTIRRL